MHNPWRAIPKVMTLTALSLLAAASFTLAPFAESGGAPVRPADDRSRQLESPIERGGGDDLLTPLLR